MPCERLVLYTRFEARHPPRFAWRSGHARMWGKPLDELEKEWGWEAMPHGGLGENWGKRAVWSQPRISFADPRSGCGRSAGGATPHVYCFVQDQWLSALLLSPFDPSQRFCPFPPYWNAVHRSANIPKGYGIRIDTYRATLPTLPYSWLASRFRGNGYQPAGRATAGIPIV